MKKRLFSLLMVLCLVLSMLPTSAFAADVEYLDSVYITEHNPLYPHDSCSVEEHAPTVDALHPLEGGQYEDDLSVASAAIREAMKNRQSTVSVNVFLDGDTHSGESEDTKALIRRLFHDAYAHTGNPTEGDYLRWVYAEMGGGSSGWKSNGDYYLTFTYNITYYTTAAQEQAVTDKLATVMPTFGFTSATTDYEKVKAIYDYICANVTYDHENLENDSYKLKYTAYAALINGTSVCQGYATLLYRMLLMVGVDTRVVTGTAGGGNHGWNIVKLGAYYYNADSTWDAGETEYDYFLTCPANFDPTHTRGADYTTAAFHTAYPMADADYDPHTADTLPEGLTYTVSGDNVTITGYTGTLTELTIPSTIEGKRVTDIGEGAFYNLDKLTSVKLPDSLTSIGDDAFYDCDKLTCVNIPAGVTSIGSHAFYGCSVLASISIPNSVTTIGSYSFNFCSTLPEVIIPNSVTTIGNGAFSGCDGLTEIVIPNSVTSLGKKAFYNCAGLTKATIPNSLTSLSDDLFCHCTNLTEITLPDSITSVGSYAFDKCNIKKLIVADGSQTVTSNMTISTIEEVVIPDSVTYISAYAFTNCTKLKKVSLPKNVTLISRDAFKGCTDLTEVILPEGITLISVSAFENCTSLAKINIPSSVTTIGSKAFYNCDSLTEITLPDSITTIPSYLFSACTGLTKVTLGSHVTLIDTSAFNSCGSLTEITIPATVTAIKSGAFYDCRNLSQITFLGDLPNITYNSFSKVTGTALYPCNNDTWTDAAVSDLAADSPTVTWTANHNYVGGLCSLCGGIERVTSGQCGENVYWTLDDNGTLSINGTGAMDNYYMKSYEDGNPSTPTYAPWYHRRAEVTAISIASGITSIGHGAFAGCAITEVDIPAGVTSIGNDAFNGCTSLAEVALPAGLQTIGTGAFSKCSALTELQLPDSVTTIGHSAFSKCTGLTELNIPASVTSMGDYVFNGSGIATVTFLGNPPTFSENCFAYGSVTTALYPCDNDTWTDTKVAELAAAHTSVTWTADHDPKTVSGTPNSCFTGGISDGVQCTICEEWLTPQTPVPAGHKNENGYCTVCGLPEGLEYTDNGDGIYAGDEIIITGYTGSLTELTIPAIIEGKPVTTIASCSGSDITKIVIPNSVTSIDNSAFSGCGYLATITIPDSVTFIGDSAFDDCVSLTAITIPDSVTYIGNTTFSGCRSLASVTIGNSVTTIGEHTFLNCKSLTSVTLPDSVTTIATGAFYGCSLASVTIGSGVTSIGDNAFAYNYSSEEKVITFTGNIPVFLNDPFQYCFFTAYYPCDNDTWTDAKVTGLASAHTSVTWTAAHDPKTVPGTPNSCFTGGISDGVQCTICEEWLTPQTPVPAGHKLIVDGYCTVCGLPEGLLYTVNGDTVTVTDYTGSLTELNIPATINGKPVTAIDNYAFDGCVRLTRISLPDSVTYIGNGAFMDCRALENVNIPAGVTAMNGNTFSNCKSLKSVILPAGVTAIGNYAFDGCTALESLIIPDGVTDIGNYAFEGCSALTGITIPAAVASVGKHAFVYCSRLAEVRFLGNAPIFGFPTFPDITATAYYPCGDTTWTETKLQNHGGSITWMVEHHYVDGVCPGCGKMAGAVDGVYRLAGRNRFDTAFQSADALKEVMGVEKFPAAIVTSGMNFADALAGSYLAAVTGAPILLTDNDNMADVIAYIRENVKAGGTVYALGGTAVVADTLKAVESSGYQFKRLAGSNRFATNLMILEEAGIRSGDPVLVCTAYNFADSLSASALGMPILLVDDTVSAEQLSFLRENADGEFILVGGTGAVKPAVETQLKTLSNVVRLAGNNRFDTSVLTAVESFGNSVDYAVLAYGYNFPDGLCAGPLAYALGAPLILTANGDEAAAAVYANTVGITDGFVLGGPSLISDDAAYRIFSTDTVLDGLN